MTHQDHYVTQMKLQLDEMNAKMVEVEGRVKLANASARDTWRTEVDVLHRQSRRAAEILEALRLAGDESWQLLSNEMDKMFDTFRHTFRTFLARA